MKIVTRSQTHTRTNSGSTSPAKNGAASSSANQLISDTVVAQKQTLWLVLWLCQAGPLIFQVLPIGRAGCTPINLTLCDTWVACRCLWSACSIKISWQAQSGDSAVSGGHWGDGMRHLHSIAMRRVADCTCRFGPGKRFSRFSWLTWVGGASRGSASRNQTSVIEQALGTCAPTNWQV
jgi:hypothetical protein